MISAEHLKKCRLLADRWLTIKQPIAYLGILILAECLTTLVDARLGLFVHCALLGGLLYHSTVSASVLTQRLLLSLTVLPMIRIVSVSLPLSEVNLIYWYFIISIPLFVSILIVRRSLDISWAVLGLVFPTPKAIFQQVLIASTGVVFGYLEHQILKPEGLIRPLEWNKLILPALILLICTGFLEELVFRGIMQKTAVAVFSQFGIIYVAVAWAALHIGYQSILDLAFVFGVGLFFGFCVYRTGSIAGVSVAHGITNIMLYLVLPI